jgi:3-oxoacyl-[acyl-carrier protein] reductase
MKRLEQRIAIITGPGQGIGRAIALGLAREGATVVIAEINEASVITVKNEIEASGGRALVIGTGRLDVLVNLAGGTLHRRMIHEFSLSDWREVIDINLKGTFLCCQAVIKPMKEQKGGIIIIPLQISALPAVREGQHTRLLKQRL